MTTSLIREYRWGVRVAWKPRTLTEGKEPAVLIDGTPVTTTCDRPEIDRDIRGLINAHRSEGMSVRAATEAAARKVADAAQAQRWNGELIDFVVIRTVHLGALMAAAETARP